MIPGPPTVRETSFCAVSAGLDQYAALNATVWGISGDNPFAQEQWALTEKIALPLLSDYEHRVAQAYGCAYDSFLPEQNLYLEITVMKQRLVTRKNRKLRKLRERYPDVRVKLFYKRDIERLAQRYRLDLAS